MQADPKITDFAKLGRPWRSVEFFPPRDDDGMERLAGIAASLKPLDLDFVSVTYGAGGSTRERSFAVAERLRKDQGWVVMPHLTCVGATPEAMSETVRGLHAQGFRNIMALGGDLPKDMDAAGAYAGGLRYGSDLVSLIRSLDLEMCLGVGGYPEKHPSAPSLDKDLEHLKFKVGQGANFITTQLFFHNQVYFDFVDRCRAVGITQPIVPGIMPVLSLKQIRRFTELCGSEMPQELMQRLEAVGDDDPEGIERVGVEWAVGQIHELIDRGAPGIHLYVLNRSRAALSLAENLAGTWTPASIAS